MSNHIAENIKKLREIYNLTQQDLAKIAGVTYQAVSAWERGIKQPRMGAIQKIADYFSLNKSNIIEEDGMSFFYQHERNNSKKKIGRRIRELRMSKGLTLEELGTIVGLNKSTVKRYEDGEIKNLTVDNLKLFAKALDVDPEYIMALDNYNEVKTSRIKVYGKICAGNGELAYEDFIDEIYNPYPRAKGKLIALQVNGNSMNKVIANGDYAIIRLQQDVNNGEIAAVIIDNEDAMLKRVYKVDQETIVLKPESTEPFEAITFVGEQINQIRIIGKLIGGVKPFIE